MDLLLDTCTFLWFITDSAELSGTAEKLITDGGNDVYLSAVSAWEISIKHAIGRLPLPEEPRDYIRAQREHHDLLSLPMTEESALHVSSLPALHRDPFDREI